MEDVRRAILDHAVELVAERGVRGVSFREVARRAGVSHQAPYHHFGNLQGILEALTREGFQRLTAVMSEALDAHLEPVDALNAVGIAYVRFATANVGHFRVMFQRNLVDLHNDASPIEEAAHTYGTLRRAVAQVVAADYAPGLDIDGLTHLCWASAHGLASLLVEGTLQTKATRDTDTEIASVMTTLSHLIHHCP